MFVWRTNCSSLNCNTRHIKHVCKENTHTCIRTHHPRHACNTHRITITEERHLRESLINVLRLVKLYWQPLWHNLNHMETHTLDDLTRSEPQDIELAHAASKSTIKVVHLLCPLYSKSSGTSGFNTLFSWLHRGLWKLGQLEWMDNIVFFHPISNSKARKYIDINIEKASMWFHHAVSRKHKLCSSLGHFTFKTFILV